MSCTRSQHIPTSPPDQAIRRDTQFWFLRYALCAKTFWLSAKLQWMCSNRQDLTSSEEDPRVMSTTHNQESVFTRRKAKNTVNQTKRTKETKLYPPVLWLHLILIRNRHLQKAKSNEDSVGYSMCRKPIWTKCYQHYQRPPSPVQQHEALWVLYPSSSSSLLSVADHTTPLCKSSSAADAGSKSSDSTQTMGEKASSTCILGTCVDPKATENAQYIH